MARGQQKIQSQQKNAERQAKMKKKGTDQKKAAQAALKIVCPVCSFLDYAIHMKKDFRCVDRRLVIQRLTDSTSNQNIQKIQLRRI